ncbi:MAG: HEAT repeat domain-containing protein [Oligosphaeraceae bacterium]|nr:HEAT repeat domain-containing protein [Oligosphaeraceae bacterium]
MTEITTQENLSPGAAAVENIAGLIWALPAEGGENADALLSQMEQTVPALVQRLSQQNDPPATLAFFALEAMVMRCLNPDRSEDSLRLSALLLQNLSSAPDTYSRQQLIRFVGMIGEREAAAALQPWLDHPEDFEVTLLALRNIGNNPAFENISQKLLRSQGREFFALAIALGDWELSGVLQEELLRRHLPTVQPEELPALWKACAKCKELWIAPDLLQALQEPSKVLAGAARAALHTLLTSLGGWETIELAQKFYACDHSPIALRTWFQCCSHELTDDCFDAILAATLSDNLPLRETALELLDFASSNGVDIEQLIDFATHINHEETKAAMVRMFGRHGDPVARPFVMALIHDKSQTVRLAALEAARDLQGHLPSASLQFLLAVGK